SEQDLHRPRRVNSWSSNVNPLGSKLAEIAASHHHHFHCTVCDRMFDVDGCVGKLASLLPRGFTLEDHELTLRGRCKSCSD
ncbi:MAG: hypothetical protein AAGK34_07270, partial [Planctomycetota bacterium]